MFTEVLGLYNCDCWAESLKCYPKFGFPNKTQCLVPRWAWVCRESYTSAPQWSHPTAARSSVGKTLMGWEIYVWMFPKDKGQRWPGRSWGWLVTLIPLKVLYTFLSLSWFEVENNFEMPIPSPQVIFPDPSHPTATTFAILLNISCLCIYYAGVH